MLHGSKGTFAGSRMVSKSCAGYELFCAVGAGVLECAGKMLGLDVTAHIRDGLVLEEAAEGADAVGPVTDHELVEILPYENGTRVLLVVWGWNKKNFLITRPSGRDDKMIHHRYDELKGLPHEMNIF